MPKPPKRLIAAQKLLAEAIEYAMTVDQEASWRLYQRWMTVLQEHVPAESETREEGDAANRILFTALAHLIGSWLASQHCDVCREQWASRIALLANKIGCATVDLLAPAPADAALH